jgi:hypothetical protein
MVALFFNDYGDISESVRTYPTDTSIGPTAPLGVGHRALRLSPVVKNRIYNIYTRYGFVLSPPPPPPIEILAPPSATIPQLWL